MISQNPIRSFTPNAFTTVEAVHKHIKVFCTEYSSSEIILVALLRRSPPRKLARMIDEGPPDN
jgi:hypothetical protein